MEKAANQQQSQKLNEQNQRQNLENQRQHMRFLKQKHPDCIPIYFAKHKESSKSLKEPTTPMLFKRELKIEQAMYRLYEQIQTKGLVFFCLHQVKEQTKYVRLKPGPTIQEVYNRLGKNQSLLLIYSDEEVGMGGIKKMEKCLAWVLAILAIIWVVLFGLNYYWGWSISALTTKDSSSGGGGSPTIQTKQTQFQEIN